MLHIRYSQSTGRQEIVSDDGSAALMGVGWAGNDRNPEVNPNHVHGKNNPDAEDRPCIGPLPRGWYTIGAPVHHPKLGQLAFPLIPDAANDMHGRNAFYEHGASLRHFGEESWGCIIQVHDVRVHLAGLVAAGINRLEVVR